MAKPIAFEFGGSRITFQMNKIDRSKLYGYKELEVMDDDGHPCELATLADDGRTIVGKGGTGIGYLTADGQWCDKSKLRPVDLEGETMTPVPSSFSAPIALTDRVSIDDYMNHSIRLVYQVEIEDLAEVSSETGTVAERTASRAEQELVKGLRDGAIFKFEYSFRGGLEPDVGFLLANDQGETFMAVGDRTSIEFMGLQQTTSSITDESDADDEDPMDFGMI